MFKVEYARLAQSVEHQTFNLRVAGSSPSSGASLYAMKLNSPKESSKGKIRKNTETFDENQ